MPASLKMLKHLAAACAVLGALLLATGCATVKRVTPADREHIRAGATGTIVYLPQGGLQVTIQESDLDTANPSGLLAGILIEVSNSVIRKERRETAETAAWPVRDELLGYDPGTSLSTALTRELASLEWMKKNAVEVRQPPDPADSEPLSRLMKAREVASLLLVGNSYMLTPSFDGIAVGATVELYSNQAVATGKPELVYRNWFWVFATSPEIIGDNVSLDQAARIWSENNGQEAHQALNVCYSELARMIAYDLQKGELPELDQAAGLYQEGDRRPETSLVTDIAGHEKYGYSVHKENGRTWYRLAGGALYSLGGISR